MILTFLQCFSFWHFDILTFWPFFTLTFRHFLIFTLALPHFDILTFWQFCALCFFTFLHSLRSLRSLHFDIFHIFGIWVFFWFVFETFLRFFTFAHFDIFYIFTFFISCTFFTFKTFWHFDIFLAFVTDDKSFLDPRRLQKMTQNLMLKLHSIVWHASVEAWCTTGIVMPRTNNKLPTTNSSVGYKALRSCLTLHMALSRRIPIVTKFNQYTGAPFLPSVHIPIQHSSKRVVSWFL